MPEAADNILVPIRQQVAPLRLRIIQSVRRAIERGVLSPGQRLVEKDLCLQLEVSRTSLREALRELEADGVLTHVSNRGLTVARIGYRDAENIYRIRAEIEAITVEQFIEKATDEDVLVMSEWGTALVEAYRLGARFEILESKRRFYDYICIVADNNVASEILNKLTLRTSQLRAPSVSRPERQAQSILEIEELTEAIRTRDVRRAIKAARNHVRNAARSALSLIES
tara:strand:- start:6299 stop:6979 length:681 start_codon:yes stop_codon:yes gene_type:complete